MGTSVIRIERKDATASRAAEALRSALQAAERRDVTPADAAAVSGLPLAMCEEALWRLAAECRARIRVSESGALRFTFASLAPVRPGPWARLEAWARRNAMGLKLAGLLVLVPPYFLTVGAHALALTHLPPGTGPLGAVLGLVGIVAALPVLLLGVGSFFQFILAPFGGPLLLAVGLSMVPRWLAALDGPLTEFVTFLCPAALLIGLCWSLASSLFFKHWVFGDRNVFGLRVWKLVSGTLFGGDLSLDGGLTDEKRLTALVAERRGVLTTAELVALFGWTPDEADSQTARILLDYGGDVVVTDDGAIVYRFRDLATSAGAAIDTRPFYEREAAHPAFFQAPKAFVRGFLALSAIGLLGFATRPHPTLWPDWTTAPQASVSDTVMSQACGGVPYLLIALVLGVRYALWRRARAAHAAQAGHRWVVRLATEHPAGCFVKRVPTQPVAALGGTIDVDRTRPDGAVWVHFPAIALNREAAEALRAEAAAPPAGVAFDTAG